MRNRRKLYPQYHFNLLLEKAKQLQYAIWNAGQSFKASFCAIADPQTDGTNRKLICTFVSHKCFRF